MDSTGNRRCIDRIIPVGPEDSVGIIGANFYSLGDHRVLSNLEDSGDIDNKEASAGSEGFL